MALPKLSESVVASLADVGQVDVAIGLLTYNNAETLDAVLAVAADGLARHFPTPEGRAGGQRRGLGRRHP